MRSLCWKCNFRANFGVLPQGFDVKALIPQGFTGSPNYFGFLNNLMTLIICESLREIGEVACVTSAWSSRGQTLKGFCSLNSTLFMSLNLSSSLSKLTKKTMIFHQPQLHHVRHGLGSRKNKNKFAVYVML